MARAVWIGGAMAIIFFAAGVVIAQRPEPAIRQPIQFNHARHKEKGVPCAFCHEYVEGQAIAGLPKVETCMLCHIAPLTESEEEDKVRRAAEKGDQIPWQRLYRIPEHVFFSHRRHVTLAKLECRTCHGSIGEAMVPPGRPAVAQSMEWCIACHDRRQASVDCNACHR